MKKLDRLVILSFIGPFILTFFIALFVLVMQFLWKYVDDLVGKGLNTFVLIELLFYASARLVPMALPLAVLLASIMTFGAFGEFFELTAVKASGVYLFRFMGGLLVTVFFISVFAFIFSNNILPYANLKFGALIYDIQRQKPSLAIKEGRFYNGIDGYNLRVAKKGKDGSTLYDILVFDHTSNKGDDHLISARKGEMLQDESHHTLTLRLENGKQYKEMESKDPKQNKYEMYRTTFKSWEKKFDMTQFKLTHTDEAFFKDLKQMLNLAQLSKQIDTLHIDLKNLHKQYADYVLPYYEFKKYGWDTVNTLKAVTNKTIQTPHDFYKEYKEAPKPIKIAIAQQATAKARNIKNYTEVSSKQIEYKYYNLVQHLTEVYRKFTLSIACLVLFLIGAPLGSIIRKGGLGWPLFYSILFFILYWVSSIMGEKMAEKMVLSPAIGMWLSTFILLPIGIFLTLKATNDSKIYNVDYYVRFFRKLFVKQPAAA